MVSGADVSVEGVTRRFGEHVTALRDVSLHLRPGELVLLKGPSGAGKSTLLNLIAGYDRPDAGRILVDGEPIDALRDVAAYRRGVIGFVFQLHHLIGGLTAEENVEVPLIPEGGRRPARLSRARARARLPAATAARRRADGSAGLRGGTRGAGAARGPVTTEGRHRSAGQPRLRGGAQRRSRAGAARRPPD
jgi:putative ABC transport system ATP-binding protein